MAIDITGKHPKSRNGNEYMLTVMDHFSKWEDAYPHKDQKKPKVATVLFEQMFSRLGMPDQLQSDQGRILELFPEMCKWRGIEKIRTSPYRPACNGMLEVYHRTLHSKLYVEKNH